MKSVVKGDLHLHSNYSDGVNRPEEYVHYALKKNFRIISITDHNTFRGSQVALKYVKEHNLQDRILVIPGCEVRTEVGDILVYCPEPHQECPPRRLVDLLDWCSENSCLYIPAHPLDITRHGIGLFRLISGPWVAIEAYNGGTIIPLLNEITYIIARSRNLIPIGNSDAHSIYQFGTCYTVFRVDDLSYEDFVRTILRGDVTPIQEVGVATRLYRKVKTKLLKLRKRV